MGEIFIRPTVIYIIFGTPLVVVPLALQIEEDQGQKVLTVLIGGPG